MGDGSLYIGSSQDAPERLRRHNLGNYRYTKGHRPWVLIYEESFASRSEAYKKELFYKSGVGRKLLQTQLLNI